MEGKRLFLQDSCENRLIFVDNCIVGKEYLGRIGLAVNIDKQNLFPFSGKPGSQGDAGCCFAGATFL